MNPDTDASRRVVATPPPSANSPRRRTVTVRNNGPGDADLPDSDDDDDDDDANDSGLPLDDPDFPTPSTIKVTSKTFTEIEWLRPQVSVLNFNTALFLTLICLLLRVALLPEISNGEIFRPEVGCTFM